MAKTPVIKQDATKGKFKDSEMEKVKPKESLDDMFENLDGDVPAASTDTAAPAPSTDDAAPAAEEGTGDMSTYDQLMWDNTEASDDKTPPAAAAEETTTDDAAPAAEEGEGDELDALLKKIAVETTEAKDAAEEVKTVTDNPQSTPEDIKKVVEDYEAKMATLTQTVSDVTRERDLERKRSGDLLEQKFQIESDAQEKGKIYDEVMWDPTLKTLVAFKSAANANPKLKQRYVDQLKSLYEQESGESIDELKEGARSNQKSLQTQADYSTPANVNGKGGGVSDMFEDMD